MARHPSGLTQKEIAELKGLLDKKLHDVDREVKDLEYTLTQTEDDEKAAPDEVDRSSFEEEMQRIQLVLDGKKHIRNEIHEAFTRMEDSVYGVCEESEEPIGFKRLQAAPWTRLSIEAQQELEQRRKNGPRMNASAAYASAYSSSNDDDT